MCWIQTTWHGLSVCNWPHLSPRFGDSGGEWGERKCIVIYQRQQFLCASSTPIPHSLSGPFFPFKGFPHSLLLPKLVLSWEGSQHSLTTGRSKTSGHPLSSGSPCPLLGRPSSHLLTGFLCQCSLRGKLLVFLRDLAEVQSGLKSSTFV